MTEVQEQIFDYLRGVAAFAHQNGLADLQNAVDRAEEVAITEVLGIDLTAPIEIEDYANVMEKIMPYFGEQRT